MNHLPPMWPQVFDFHMEERQEGRATEWTSAVKVGVICRPACHDFLIIHQTVTRLTEGAAGHQHLHQTGAGQGGNEDAVQRSVVTVCASLQIRNR